jgi:hypothetical protein
MKIRPVGAEVFDADRRTAGRTHTTKLITDFRNFANVPKNLGECIRARYPEQDAATETICQ